MDMPAGLNPAESEAVIGADDPDGAGAREVTFLRLQNRRVVLYHFGQAQREMYLDIFRRRCNCCRTQEQELVFRSRQDYTRRSPAFLGGAVAGPRDCRRHGRPRLAVAQRAARGAARQRRRIGAGRAAAAPVGAHRQSASILVLNLIVEAILTLAWPETSTFT